MNDSPSIFDLRDENCTNLIITLSSILRVIPPDKEYILLITKIQRRQIDEIIEQFNVELTCKNSGEDLKIFLKKKI